MTIYKQLEDILNKCIEKWWRPIFDCVYSDIYWVYYERWDWERMIEKSIEMHWLFSKDSGLMEFVEWNDNWYRIVQQDAEDTDHEYTKKYSSETGYNYMIMWPMTADEKIQYFISNAIIPWLK